MPKVHCTLNVKLDKKAWNSNLLSLYGSTDSECGVCCRHGRAHVGASRARRLPSQGEDAGAPVRADPLQAAGTRRQGRGMGRSAALPPPAAASRLRKL